MRPLATSMIAIGRHAHDCALEQAMPERVGRRPRCACTPSARQRPGGRCSRRRSSAPAPAASGSIVRSTEKPTSTGAPSSVDAVRTMAIARASRRRRARVSVQLDRAGPHGRCSVSSGCSSAGKRRRDVPAHVVGGNVGAGLARDARRARGARSAAARRTSRAACTTRWLAAPRVLDDEIRGRRLVPVGAAAQIDATRKAAPRIGARDVLRGDLDVLVGRQRRDRAVDFACRAMQASRACGRSPRASVAAAAATSAHCTWNVCPGYRASRSASCSACRAASAQRAVSKPTASMTRRLPPMLNAQQRLIEFAQLAGNALRGRVRRLRRAAQDCLHPVERSPPLPPHSSPHCGSASISACASRSGDRTVSRRTIRARTSSTPRPGAR